MRTLLPAAALTLALLRAHQRTNERAASMQTNREWPCTQGNVGRGYANCARRNAIIHQPAIPTLKSAADRLVPAEWTIRRWTRQRQQLGHVNQLPHGGGRKLKLSRAGAAWLWWEVMVDASSTFLERRDWGEDGWILCQVSLPCRWARVTTYV